MEKLNIADRLSQLEEFWSRDVEIIGRSITSTAEGGKPAADPDLHGGAS
jgi:hypothetical protein